MRIELDSSTGARLKSRWQAADAGTTPIEQLVYMSRIMGEDEALVLWGGGNTTSVGPFPADDGGWLSGKIKKYFENPKPLGSKE